MGRWSAAALASVLGGLAACGDPGGETVEVSLDDLPCQSLSADGIWQSAPLPPSATGDCSWFFFAANNTYIFDHPLGRVPSQVVGLISFNEDGTASTIAAGNVFLVVAADESTTTIRNGQNQPFWLRLVLE